MLITVELSEATARLVHQIAVQTGRPPEVVVRDLVDRSVADVPVETLPDAEVLALADMVMRDDEQAELADLLDDQREGVLDSASRERLAALLQGYGAQVRGAQGRGAAGAAPAVGVSPMARVPISPELERLALTVRANWVSVGWHPPQDA